MSRNLVEIVRRHHEVGAPTALAVLKEAMERRGEITDEDRRVAAERSGLPEAAVHGVSTFYDDLLQPRGARHLRVCTGTACFAATGGAHVDALREGLGGLRDRAHRAGPRLHRLSLPRDPDEPADRAVGGRQHVVPGVQGRRGRRAAGGRAGQPHAGDRVGVVIA